MGLQGFYLRVQLYQTIDEFLFVDLVVVIEFHHSFLQNIKN